MCWGNRQVKSLKSIWPMGKFSKEFLGKNKRKYFQWTQESYYKFYISKGVVGICSFILSLLISPGSADDCFVLVDMRWKLEWVWGYEEQKPKNHIVFGGFLRCHEVQLSNQVVTLCSIPDRWPSSLYWNISCHRELIISKGPTLFLENSKY